MGKTLIVNGSPRENGYCAKVCQYIADKTGGEIIDCEVGHCTGCDACRDGNCIIDDKMQTYYDLIKKADNIILVSPLYFSMLTGKMLTFASRWQYFYHNPIKSEKHGTVILLGGGSTKDTSKAFSTAKIILKYAGIQTPETIAFVGTDAKDPMRDEGFLQCVNNVVL